MRLVKLSKVFAFVSGVVLGAASFSCGHGLQLETAKSRAYGDDIAICRAYSETCLEMVICQHATQRAHGYPISGTCKGKSLADWVDSDAGSTSSRGDASSAGGL